MNHKIMWVLLLAVFLNGCAWVELSAGGKKVRVLTADEVSTCKHLGKTTANVADKVAGLKRKDHIVSENIEMLARNAAAEMNGDTIVAITPIENGKQTFNVYRCVGP